MASLRTLFLGDLRIKALALVMALAIYVHVFSGQVGEAVLSVPLSIAPLSGGLVLANDIPALVRVRVHASGRDLLKLRTRGFHAELKIDSPRAGSLQRPLLQSDFQMPRGVKPISVEALEPPILHLQIEQAASVQLPVATRLNSAIPADRALVRRPVPTPGVVRVSGPRSKLALLDSVRTLPVAMEGLRGDFEREIDLDLPQNVTAEPRRVKLRIELEEKVERWSRLLPVDVVLPPWTRLLAVEPESASVSITGAASTVGQLEPISAKLVAEIPRRGGRTQMVPLRATVSGLPPGAPVTVRCDPESVQVLVR